MLIPRTSLGLLRASLHLSPLRLGVTQLGIEQRLRDHFKCSSGGESVSRCHYHAQAQGTTGRLKVCVLGGGSWGTAVADLAAANVIKYPEYFDTEVTLCLRDQALCEMIELRHENVKYLPTIRLQTNIKPMISMQDALALADVIIFAVPQEYIADVCFKINDVVTTHRRPVGLSLVKGLSFDTYGNFERISQLIERMVGIKVGVLSGANVAIQVAQRQYCEATLCSPDIEDRKSLSKVLKSLFHSEFFKVTLSDDQPTVEICGALKNVVACGAGLIDGLGAGINTKSAAIVCGLREMISFVQLVHPNFEMKTIFGSSGVSDLIASSFGGRNRKIGEAFVRYHQQYSLAELEANLLHGQKLQGPSTARSVYRLLEEMGQLSHFPFFTAVHRIFNDHEEPKLLLDAIRSSQI